MIKGIDLNKGFFEKIGRMISEHPVLLCNTILLIAALAAYLNTFFFSSFNFDDSINILGANAQKNLGTLSDLFSLKGIRSFGQITFAINYRMFGEYPQAFHVTNLLIHLFAALFLASLVRLTLTIIAPERAGSTAVLFAAPLVSALLFLLHPLQTQAVSYIVQRFTSLAAMLYICSLLFYAKGRVQMRSISPSSGVLHLIISLILMFLAMKTKEIAFTLPVMILLYEFVFFKGDRKWKTAMLLFMVIPLTVIPLAVYGTSLFSQFSTVLDKLRVQTNMPRSTYFFSELPVIVTYLRMIILPYGQSAEHLPQLYKSFSAFPVMASALLILSIFISGAALLFSRKTPAHWKFAGFGIIWFFVAISIESSFIPIIDLMFEHRVYLPFAGFCFAAAPVTLKIFDKEKSRNISIILTLALFSILAVLTGMRNQVWKNPVALWSDAAEKAPSSSRAWNNLAFAWLKVKNPDKALVAIIRSIELDPSRPDAWNNIGVALDQLGIYKGRYHRVYNKFESASDYYGSQLVWFANSYNSMGLARQHLGQYAAAILAYKKAIEMKPDLATARFNLGMTAIETGNPSLAISEYEKLKELAPQMAETLRGMIEKGR